MVPGRWGSSELLSRDGGSGEGLGLWLDLLCAVKHRPKGKGRSEVTGLPLRPQASPLNCSKNGDMKRVLVGCSELNGSFFHVRLIRTFNMAMCTVNL